MDTVITVVWPNYDIELWRDWLEENAGPQGEAWQWGMSKIGNPDMLDIHFAHAEHAALFALCWIG